MYSFIHMNATHFEKIAILRYVPFLPIGLNTWENPMCMTMAYIYLDVGLHLNRCRRHHKSCTNSKNRVQKR